MYQLLRKQLFSKKSWSSLCKTRLKINFDRKLSHEETINGFEMLCKIEDSILNAMPLYPEVLRFAVVSHGNLKSPKSLSLL